MRTTFLALAFVVFSFSLDSMAADHPLRGLAGNVDCAARAQSPQTFSVVTLFDAPHAKVFTSRSKYFLFDSQRAFSCSTGDDGYCIQLAKASSQRAAHKTFEKALRAQARKYGSWKCPHASGNVRSAFDPDGWVSTYP